MKWSLKIGRWWGVDVQLHVTFLLLLGVIGLQEESLRAAISGMLLYVCLFACVLLHEFGHVLTARHYGITTRDITLLPIGGVARLERLPDNPRHELAIAVAGPLVNVALGGALAAFLWLAGRSPIPSAALDAFSFAQRLFVVNVSLVVFNLLPAFPMDGGRVLRALLAMVLDPVRATRIAAGVGRFMAVVFAGVALYYQMYVLLFIAVFVWLGAGGEARATEVRAVIGGAVVGQAMQTRTASLASHDSLESATQRMLAGSVPELLVLHEDRVVGMLVRDDLLEALKRHGPGTPVAQVMRTDLIFLDAAEPLEPALLRLSAAGVPAAPVYWQGRLVGVFRPDAAADILALRRAQAAADNRPPVIPRTQPSGESR
ncbi:MAG: site-2 protease family protein [Verrucomicrobia bacterium]|nr:site-2 protease family protein [Verrucomicrobiota bacterium]